MGHTFFLCTKWRYFKWGENIIKHLVVDTKHHPRVLRYVLKIESPLPNKKNVLAHSSLQNRGYFFACLK